MKEYLFSIFDYITGSPVRFWATVIVAFLIFFLFLFCALLQEARKKNEIFDYLL